MATLDPTPALVVIDLQRGIAGPQRGEAIAAVVDNSVVLAEAFRARGFPVVLVNVTGRPAGRTSAPATVLPADPGWSELIDELTGHPDDLLVTKQTAGAFHRTQLDALLRERGVTQVVLTGVATSMGVEATGRAAYEHGYTVLFATDAMTDRSPAVHDNSVEGVFPRIGETATTAEILELLRT